MNKRTIKIAAIAALTVTTLLSSCVLDTKESMAWGDYHEAKDSLDAGNPYAAQEILKYYGKGGRSVLGRKVDSLRLVIEKAIEEDKNKTAKDSI